MKNWISFIRDQDHNKEVPFAMVFPNEEPRVDDDRIFFHAPFSSSSWDRYVSAFALVALGCFGNRIIELRASR